MRILVVHHSARNLISLIHLRAHADDQRAPFPRHPEYEGKCFHRALKLFPGGGRGFFDGAARSGFALRRAKQNSGRSRARSPGRIRYFLSSARFPFLPFYLSNGAQLTDRKHRAKLLEGKRNYPLAEVEAFMPEIYQKPLLDPF